MKAPKPKWWRLYAVLPLGAALLVGADLVAPSAGWRAFTEVLVSLATLGAIALWLRANRVALMHVDKPLGAKAPLRAWVAYCPPPIPRRNRGAGESVSKHSFAGEEQGLEGEGTCFAT
jgi:hypothetical protein